MERGKKRVVDSQLESVHLVRMNHLNSAGRLFGGQLMQWLTRLQQWRQRDMHTDRSSQHRLIICSFCGELYPGDTVVLQGKDCLCRTYIYGCQSGDLCRDGNRRTVSD